MKKEANSVFKNSHFLFRLFSKVSFAAVLMALLVFSAHPAESAVFFVEGEGDTGDFAEKYDSGSGIYYRASGTRRHDVPNSSYTGLSNQPQYDAVGDILFSNTVGSGTFRCSGTLISADWVLTAGHCMDGGDGTGPSVPASITFNLPGAPIVSGDLGNVVVHPNWNGNLTNGKDIALFKLNSPINSVTPAQRYDTGTHGSELGRTATSVGYGRTGTGVTGDTGGSGTRKAGNNVLDAFGNSFGWSTDLLLTDFDEPGDPSESTLGSSTPLALEYNIAPGDSGGGAFTLISGTHYVTGVHSLLWSNDGNTNADYGDGGGFTRVSVFNSWIDTVIAIPEPASTSLAFLGMLSLLALPRNRS